MTVSLKAHALFAGLANSFKALRAVTKVAIREARTRELRQELLRSETLKR